MNHTSVGLDVIQGHPLLRPLLGLISYMTRRWELLPHARSAVNGRHCLYVHVHDVTQALLHVSKRGSSANDFSVACQ